ncbi:MAG: hypothetical protein GKS06_13840 [Acidobacteria bacterium]|nr:hypothetical protein [Acidobacteriota bacterium]
MINRLVFAMLCTAATLSAGAQEPSFEPEDTHASFQVMAEYLARDGGRWIGDNPNHDGSERSPHAFGLWFERDVRGHYLELKIVAHFADRDVISSRGSWAWNPDTGGLVYRMVDRGGGLTEGVTTFPDADTFATMTTRYADNGEADHRDTNDIIGPDEHHNETFARDNGEWVSGGIYIWRRVPDTTQGAAVTRLTESGARNGQTFWSPDGERMSFVSNRDDGWQVWVMDADGGRPRRLTSEAEPVGWPSWSHDGSTIYFYGTRDGAYQMLSVPSAGGQVRLLEGTGAHAFRPLVDPSGTRLLFDAVQPDGGSNHDIYVRDLSSDEVRQLTDDPGYDSDARWSPNGEQIVFHSDRGNEAFHTQVYVMSADGSAPRQLTHGDTSNQYPSWSENGLCVAYVAIDGDNRDLWVTNVAGDWSEQLTHRGGFDSEPVWSPGNRLLLATDRYGGVELALLDLPVSVVARCG